MKQELLNELMPVIVKTKEGILKGIEIAEKECPLLIQEVLQWEFSLSLISFLTSVFMIGVFLRSVRVLTKIVRQEWKKDDEIGEHSWDNASSITGIISGVICVVSGIWGILGTLQYLTWIKILIAPKLFLLEYISNLMK